ncbi:alpha/beta hydrolase [Streptomyces sp. NPDC002057]|uniref:alpha/beta hydrolase n=1 Tax=Streptomyces sp. NPDC002057 TaxID=3154664 RepID=UPI003329683F
MTVFVLVAGVHTGGWVWEGTAARLRAAGAEAHSVTLTGLEPGDGGASGAAAERVLARGRCEEAGQVNRSACAPARPGEPPRAATTPTGPQRPTGAGPAARTNQPTADRSGPLEPRDTARTSSPDIDLETHVADVVRLIDELDAPDLVLVGHGYGVLPVSGAADRRPDRVARLVLLDTAPPRVGESALALITNPVLRAEAVHLAGEPDGDDRHPPGWVIPPPDRDAWQRHGSTDGVPDDAMEQLTLRAVPHPAATLVRPLHLAGAAAGLPTTGVLCTANGTSIALIENMVRLGDPRLSALARPEVGFLELDTGHWPMLSAPDELARTLLRAAADEGRRISPPDGELPPHLGPFVLDLPVRPRERIGRVDLHLPDTDHPRPAVIIVHGGPVPDTADPTPRDWPAYLGYARLAASLGAVGATVDHRLHGLDDYPRAAADVAAAVETVRTHPCVDGDRIALWYFSGGGLLAADPLGAPPRWLRCVAATYPVLAPLPSWGLGESRFQPAAAVRAAGRLPIVLTRVGRELPEIAATVAEFLTAATACGADVEIVDVPNGQHGFETVDHIEEARVGVRRAMSAVLGHLGVTGP